MVAYRDGRGRFRRPREGERGYVRPIDPLLQVFARDYLEAAVREKLAGEIMFPPKPLRRDHDARIDFERMTREAVPIVDGGRAGMPQRRKGVRE